MSKRTNPSALFIGVVIGLMAGSVAASGVNDKLSDMFGASSNVTQPGVAEGKMRGVMNGGNVMVRTPIVNASPVSFDPPSISAGCGGIDIYGGSMSWASKENLTQIGRAIVGNIGAYAFRQALSTISPQAEAIMTGIQDKMTDLNLESRNSCQIAQGVVNGFKDGMAGGAETEGRNRAAYWKEVFGVSRDRAEARNEGGASPAQEAVNDPEMAKILQGNWTWDSLAKTEAFDWLGSDVRTREEVMSLIGTVITCVPGQNGCEGEGTDTVKRQLEPTLRLQDFIAPMAQQSAEYNVYKCDDENCLNPSTGHKRALGTTATQLVIDKLMGSAANPGILYRMTLPGTEAGTLSNADRALIENAGPLVASAAACMGAGEMGQGYASIIVEGLAPSIVANVLKTASDQALQAMIVDLSSREGAIGATEGTEMLRKARANLFREHAEIQNLTDKSDVLGNAILRCGSAPIPAATFGSLG